jgi:hypothetical protein
MKIFSQVSLGSHGCWDIGGGTVEAHACNELLLCHFKAPCSRSPSRPYTAASIVADWNNILAPIPIWQFNFVKLFLVMGIFRIGAWNEEASSVAMPC